MSSTTIAADSLRTFIARMVVTVVTILSGIIVARWLGPHGKGVYSGVLLLVGTVMAIPGGVGAAITYDLARQRKALPDLLPSLVVLFLINTALCAAGAWVWSVFYGWTPTLTVFVAAVPPSIILAWQGGLYIGLGMLRNLNVQLAALALATLAGIVVALTIFHAGVFGALLAWVLCLYGAAAVVVWHVARLTVRAAAGVPLSSVLRDLTRFGAQSSLNTL